MQSKTMMRKQKVVQPPTYRMENEYNPETMHQYFQVSVNIIEGQNYVWSNAHSMNSYVIIVLANQKRRTNVRRNMKDPYYRETVIFELHMSINNLEQLELWLAVMESNSQATVKMIGEARIDLRSIWEQPYHQVLHKWIQIYSEEESVTTPVGYLKIDVSIIHRGQLNVMPAIFGDENLVENLLLPSGSEQQCANYVITIYQVLGIPSAIYNIYAGKNVGKQPNTFVRISFCGITVKTRVCHRDNNPAFSQQISIVEMFPNFCQDIIIDLYSAENSSNTVLATINLNLSNISHDGCNGYLPTFGPSLIHMYGYPMTNCEESPYHRGAMLLALNTIVPYYKQGIRNANIKPVEPINLETLWTYRNFCIFCPILEVSMLDYNVCPRFCGIAITIGDVSGDIHNDEFQVLIDEMKAHKLHHTGCLEIVNTDPVHGHLNFNSSLPVLQLATRLQDFRRAIYKNNMMQAIVRDLDTVIDSVETRLTNIFENASVDLLDRLYKALEDTVHKINKFLGVLNDMNTTKSGDGVVEIVTELEQKQMALQKEEMGQLRNVISDMIRSQQNYAMMDEYPGKALRKSVKELLVKSRHILQNLRYLTFKTFDGWPDLVFWFLNDGSRVAYAKVPASDIIFSSTPEEAGRYCGRIRTLFMKPLKCMAHENSNCSCIVGKVETLSWMGLYNQQSSFNTYLPKGHKLKVTEYDVYLTVQNMVVVCRSFVSKAKINNDDINSANMEYFVRINVFNTNKETQVQKGVNPQWNQVININNSMPYTHERLQISPPTVLVEVYCVGYLGKIKLVGRCEKIPVVLFKTDDEEDSHLQWHDIYKGTEITGQIFMSVLILQNAEKELKSTTYAPDEKSVYLTNTDNCELCENMDIEPISFIPTSKSYKVDVYWWGLRDVTITKKPYVVMEIEDCTIKSGIISKKQRNCNFPNSRCSSMVEATLNSPFTFNIKLYDNSTFGRMLLLGSKTIRNPSKYIISYLPKNEYEAGLKNVPIISSEFTRVNNSLLVKKISEVREKEISVQNLEYESFTNVAKWQGMFSKNVLKEEEYTLLPVKTRRNNADSENMIQDSWWLRFLRCQDNPNLQIDDLLIYSSELESQPEFSKFKDWCSTIKLYNGKKTYTHRDDLLFCGNLKIGIALYKWPSSIDVPVDCKCGLDLKRGYFHEHSNNDSAKFLVRVYLVKGMNLHIQEVATPKPYISMTCGKKHIGDRNEYSDSFNPTFGMMQEFRCNLPDDYLLTVNLYNYDVTSMDMLIGSTSIDLEDRIYTKHRATVGLARTYNLSGIRKWRDYEYPSAILGDLCRKNHLPAPVYRDSTLIINGIEYRTYYSDRNRTTTLERQENLCLDILHKWHTLPNCGYQLVPEHVETRSLYHPDKSNEQGKILMWVDIFPLDANIPEAVDITPKRHESHTLSVKIHRIKITDTNMNCDIKRGIYVKAWLGSKVHSQTTDVENNFETNREIQFDWQMLFNFDYQPGIKKLIKREKAPFTEYEENVPAILVVQLKDDMSLADDTLGTATLDINDLSPGVSPIKQSGSCRIESSKSTKRLDLFVGKSVLGWWPLHKDANGIVGMIEMDLNLLSKNGDTTHTIMRMEKSTSRDQPVCSRIINDLICNKFESENEDTNYFYIISAIIFCAVTISTVILTSYFGSYIIFEHWLYM